MADAEDSEHADNELIESMSKLQEINGELEKIDAEERSKILEVKCKYNKSRKALFKRRNEIIQSIPGFWVEAFLNHPALADEVTEEDKKVFKYMVSLDVEDLGNESDYSIIFNFSPNPYFEGTKLAKTFSLCDDGTTSVTSTAIKWKDGENITGGSAQENKGAKRPFTEDSFFSWLGVEQKILPFAEYDEMAMIIREELWTDPLKYFSNEAYEDVNGGGSENDHDDEENDDEDFNVSGSNDSDNKDRDDKENDDEDFNVSGSNDSDNNDRDDKEDDDEAFNVSGTDDDDGNDDDGNDDNDNDNDDDDGNDNDDETNDDENIEEDEMEERYVEPDDEETEESDDDDEEEKDD